MSQNKIPVLDHGYVEAVESWGSDERIIESARMSTAKGFLGWGPRHKDTCALIAGISAECDCGFPPGDEKLLRYLWEHKHATPFEFAGLVIETQAPIFVFREWHRHRTQSYNEMSARYTPLPDLNYIPTAERCFISSITNKQAGATTGAELLTEKSASEWLDRLRGLCMWAEDVYQDGLKIGIPKELARLPVPVARYSRMRASANLRNWLGFLTLRMDPAAQWEIRQYANAVGEIIAKRFPRTWELFIEGKFKIEEKQR